MGPSRGSYAFGALPVAVKGSGAGRGSTSCRSWRPTPHSTPVFVATDALAAVAAACFECKVWRGLQGLSAPPQGEGGQAAHAGAWMGLFSRPIATSFIADSALTASACAPHCRHTEGVQHARHVKPHEVNVLAPHQTEGVQHPQGGGPLRLRVLAPSQTGGVQHRAV